MSRLESAGGAFTQRSTSEHERDAELYQLASSRLGDGSFGVLWNYHFSAFLKRQVIYRLLYQEFLYRRIIDVPGGDPRVRRPLGGHNRHPHQPARHPRALQPLPDDPRARQVQRISRGGRRGRWVLEGRRLFHVGRVRGGAVQDPHHPRVVLTYPSDQEVRPDQRGTWSRRCRRSSNGTPTSSCPWRSSTWTSTPRPSALSSW